MDHHYIKEIHLEPLGLQEVRNMRTYLSLWLLSGLSR